MMPVFTPPILHDVSPVYVVQDRWYPVTQQSQNLFRHYSPRARGVNVFKLIDGTYTTYQPADELIDITYHGGHIHEVTDEEAALLTAAGYGGDIT